MAVNRSRTTPVTPVTPVTPATQAAPVTAAAKKTLAATTPAAPTTPVARKVTTAKPATANTSARKRRFNPAGPGQTIGGQVSNIRKPGAELTPVKPKTSTQKTQDPWKTGW